VTCSFCQPEKSNTRMRVRPQSLALLPWLLFVFTALADSDSELAENWLIERVEEHGTLQGHRAVAIENFHGDVRVRTSNDHTVSVFAVIQRHAADTQEPEIALDPKEPVFRVMVRYPIPDPYSASAPPPGHDKRRVDIAVLVPKLVRIGIETDKGRAESKGHAGPLEITTVAGTIIVVTKGSLTAKSDRGPVQVTFRNRVWAQPSSIETRTGDIRVQLMEHPDVRVEMETAGEIATDYSIEIDSFPGTARKQALARIGGAKHRLRLKSAAGRIAINRIFDWIRASPTDAPVAPRAGAPSRSE